MRYSTLIMIVFLLFSSPYRIVRIVFWAYAPGSISGSTSLYRLSSAPASSGFTVPEGNSTLRSTTSSLILFLLYTCTSKGNSSPAPVESGPETDMSILSADTIFAPLKRKIKLIPTARTKKIREPTNSFVKNDIPVSSYSTGFS